MKRKLPPVSIAMIAYNEETNIQNVLREYAREILQKLPAKSELLIYLDKPTDRTPQKVYEVAKKLKIKVLEGKKNVGYAQAMKRVLLATKNPVVFYSDSSGKHQAKDFWKLIQHIDEADIINGQRFNRSDPGIRQIITFLQRLMVVVLFQVSFHDYNTGYKVLHRRVLTAVLKQCKYTKQSFSTELLLRAVKKGYSIKSIPVVFRARRNDKEGTNFKQLPFIIFDNAKGLFLLLKEFWQ